MSLNRAAVAMFVACAAIGSILAPRTTIAAVAATTAVTPGGDAVARVDKYLGALKTLGAEFTQVVRGKDGEVTERASGTLSIARPNRFRWDYREPYEQTIVADGTRLWLYDPDLDQVTVRSLEQGLGATPAMLLSGAGKVGDAFTNLGTERRGDWTWCRLAPMQSGSDFETVSLAFDAKGELAAMELHDKLGQSTSIEFAGVRRDRAIDDALFRFVPPRGADVIGDATR